RRRAAAQQHVGEAAGGGAYIRADPALDTQPEVIQRAGELLRAAPNVVRVGLGGDLGLAGDERRGTRHELAVDPDRTRAHQDLCALARRREATRYQLE